MDDGEIDVSLNRNVAECVASRKHSVDLYSLLGVQSVNEVVRRGRLRWFGPVERKSGCRPVKMWWWQG